MNLPVLAFAFAAGFCLGLGDATGSSWPVLLAVVLGVAAFLYRDRDPVRRPRDRHPE